MSGESPCPQCGNSYKSLASHWTKNANCEHPSFSDRQHAILRGTLITAGSVEASTTSNPSVRITSTNRAFLQWFTDQFGLFTRDITKVMTAEEAADEIEERYGKRPENPQPEYEAGLNAHPDLRSYRDRWYEPDPDADVEDPDDAPFVKRVPVSLARDPATLVAWYLVGGRFTRGRENKGRSVLFPLGRVAAADETIRELLSPFNPRIYQAQDGKEVMVRNSQAFFDYIRDEYPSDGFEDKWPSETDDVLADERAGDVCPMCGNSFRNLAKHWGSANDCTFPPLTDRERDIITALLVGGAQLFRTGETKRAILSVDASDEGFIQWLDTELGVLVGDIQQRTEADAQVKNERLRAWVGDEKPVETFGTVHRLQTRGHPALEEWFDWAQKDPPRPLLESASPPSKTFLQTLYAYRGGSEWWNDTEYPVIRTARVPVEVGGLINLLEEYDPAYHSAGDSPKIILKNADAFTAELGEVPPY